MLPEPGWSIGLLNRSPTGTTWSKPSRKLLGQICAPWELLGSPKLPPAARRIHAGLHLAISKQRTELPNITDSDVIGSFLAGTTCHDLVSKLGRKTPTRQAS
jgi:hypothetical protein